MIAFLAAWSVRALALSAAVAAALALTRTHNAYWRKTLWTAALAGMLAMPLLMPLHIGALGTAPTTLALQVLSPTLGLRPAAAVSLASLYAVMAIALLLYYGGGMVRLAALRAAARPVCAPWTQRFDVRVSATIRQPATFGTTILLPANYEDWTALERTAILAHEQAHVRDRDCYRLWLAQLYQCICWFNPLAWWLTRHLSALAEATSDAAAIRRLGDGPGYAQLLLEFAAGALEGKRRVHLPPGAAAMFREGLSARIERILGASAPQRPPTRFARRLGIVALAPAVLACALVHVEPAAALQARTPSTRQAIFIPPSRYNLRLLSTSFYPPLAAQRHLHGMAFVRVTVDAHGHATSVRLLHVTPTGAGFAAAALRFALALHYGNRAHRTEQTTLPVKFAPTRPAAARPAAPPPRST